MTVRFAVEARMGPFLLTPRCMKSTKVFECLVGRIDRPELGAGYDVRCVLGHGSENRTEIGKA